ncbi:MAG: DUF3106 domain-containing protein [Simplicispira sp.]|nr:DUF3106 domain-containing protein [Simplicispira sp.]
MYTKTPSARRTTPAFALALVLLGALTFGGFQVWQQVRMAPGTVVPAEAFTAPSAVRSNDMRPEKATAPTSGPGWEQLNTPQKLALYPLAPRWAILSEVQKRRWLLIAKTFSTLPPTEQERLHNRMTDWASLSAQQRSQARLNYAVTNKLAPDNKRAQWEAYQALSTEEKNRLAAAAARRTMGAATAVRPVSPRKLVQVPAATATTNNPANPPKIPATPKISATPEGSHAPALAVPEAKVPSTVVETAPVTVPMAVPAPLPPLPLPAPAREAAPQLSPDAAAQYSH